jgi:hypothetical protein
MYKLSQLALTNEDIAKIKKRRNLPLWIIGITCLVFDSIFLIAFDSNLNAIFIGICIFDLTMTIAMYFIYKNTEKDLDAGFKHCINGNVNSKKMVSTGKSNTPYLYFENEKIIVSYKEYKSVEPGDEVEIIYTAHTKYALSFMKL